MSEAADKGHPVHQLLSQRARRPVTLARITRTTIVASLLYGVTGSWSWGTTIETASDGRPLTDVALGGSASGWGELVILALAVAAVVARRRRRALRSVPQSPGGAGVGADRLLRGMWLFVAAVWVLTILQALIAVSLVEHQIVPPFLINGTVHVRHP